MNINGTYINQVELLEYWRMSNAWFVSRYKRMQWASQKYATANEVSSSSTYRALDHILAENRL